MSLTSRRTAMARKRYKPEEIVAKLRQQVDVLVSQGQNMGDAGQGAKNARTPRAAAGHAKRRGAVRPAGVTARGGRHYGPGCGFGVTRWRHRAAKPPKLNSHLG